MEKFVSEEIDQFKELIIAGKYHEVQDRTQHILTTKDSTDIEKKQTKILRGLILFYLGKFEYRQEIIREGLEILEGVVKESDEIDEELLILDSLYIQAMIHQGLHNHEEGIKTSEKAQEIYNRIGEKKAKFLKERQSMFYYFQHMQFYHKNSLSADYSLDIQESIDRLKKALEAVELMSIHSSLIPKTDIQMRLLYEIGKLHVNKNEYETAKGYYEEGLEIAKGNKNAYWKSLFYEHIGATYWRRGNYDKHLEYILRYQDINEKLGNLRGIGVVNGDLGIYYAEIGECKRALDYFSRAYNTLSENGKREGYPWLTNNLGSMNLFMGNYDEAIKYFEIALDYNKKIKRGIGEFSNLCNLALIYRTKGELDKALKTFEEVVQYFLKKGNKAQVAGNLIEISLTYDLKGLNKKALETLEKALKIFYEIDNKTHIAYNLYNLVLLSIKYNKNDLVQKYFTELEEITEQIEYKNVKRLALNAEAVILKNSPELRDRIRAEVLFEQLLQEDLRHYMHIEILFQFCELLLSELKSSSDKKYMTKLLKNLDKMIEIGTVSHIPHLIIESLWVKSQLALLDLDFDKARELLSQAFTIAENKGLNRLALKITKSREELIKQSIELEELEKESPTLSTIMDVIKIENGFKEIKSSEMFQFKQQI